MAPMERYISGRGAGDSSSTGEIRWSFASNNGLHVDKPGFFATTLADSGTAFVHLDELSQYSVQVVICQTTRPQAISPPAQAGGGF